MRIGIRVGERGVAQEPESLLNQIDESQRLGLATAWLNQHLGVDALTVLALAARQTRGIELGTAVVATYPRHPVALAAQALTVQAVAGGRFTLGIGPSHPVFMRGLLGIDYSQPARHTREFLSVLRPLLDCGTVAFRGEVYQVSCTLDMAREHPTPVLVGALGPRMLDVAGRLADGAITWLAGRRTLGRFVVPRLLAAATECGRPPPRVVASLPVCVTLDVEQARGRAASLLSRYVALDAYQRVLALEGVEHVACTAIIGDASAVHRELGGLAVEGVSDFAAVLFGSAEERARTLRVLAEATGGVSDH